MREKQEQDTDREMDLIRNMSLTFRPTKGLGPTHFSAFEGERKVGRIYKTAEGDWFWGVDWFEAGFKLVTDYSPTLEEAMAQLRKAWSDIMWEKVLVPDAMTRKPDAIARACSANAEVEHLSNAASLHCSATTATADVAISPIPLSQDS
jgi:hypothetical protein